MNTECRIINIEVKAILHPRGGLRSTLLVQYLTFLFFIALAVILTSAAAAGGIPYFKAADRQLYGHNAQH